MTSTWSRSGTGSSPGRSSSSSAASGAGITGCVRETVCVCMYVCVWLCAWVCLVCLCIIKLYESQIEDLLEITDLKITMRYMDVHAYNSDNMKQKNKTFAIYLDAVSSRCAPPLSSSRRTSGPTTAAKSTSRCARATCGCRPSSARGC